MIYYMFIHFNNYSIIIVFSLHIKFLLGSAWCYSRPRFYQTEKKLRVIKMLTPNP